MFRNHTVRIAALVALLSTTALPQTGMAASYLDTVQRGAKTVYTASLAEMTYASSDRTTRTLDWQRPSIELYFDLPPAERTSDIVLTLSADPLTRVANNAPLEVQFNNSKPVPVLSNGRGFEARLPFDAARSRGRRNVIRITYPAPAGAGCVAPIHGAWSIDLAASTLRIAGRAQKRHMSLAEVTDYLSKPALSPKTVGLIARGAEGTDMQALAAQGIALRTPGVPKFSVIPHGNDFNVVMVKRNRLFDITDDPMILNSKGPRIFVPRGRPTELIFTADTDAEIVHMLEIFATRSLPNTRRPITSLGEIDLQNRLNAGTIKIDKKTDLIDLASGTNTSSGAQSYTFGVEDPAGSSGEILLRLSASDNLADSSRLRVALNGKVLGAAKLDKKRKSVAFDIKPGTLNATSNVLNIVPDLGAPTGYTCPAGDTHAPSFTIGDGSRITLNKTTPSPVTELSRLTSTGGLFADAESYIVLPSGTRDYQAALRVLGRMAKSSGQGLTLADYTRKSSVAADKHILIIGPSDMTKSHLSGAPKAFRDALSGQSSTGENLLQANFEGYASAGSDEMAVQYAAAQEKPRKVSRGGIAALYGSGNGKLTGAITAAPGQSFVTASNTLVELDHWNALQGGVARWTSSSVVMAQTAQSDAGISLPVVKPKFEFPDLGFSSARLPDLSWPDINWPDFDMPQVNLPTFKWPEFQSTKTSENEASPVMQRDGLEQNVSLTTTKDKVRSAAEASVKPIKVADVTPRLKPTFKMPVFTKPVSNGSSKLSTGLRGTYQFETIEPSRFGSFQDLRRNTKSKWSATKIWFQTKVDGLRDMKTLEDAARATDRLQDRVTPAGRSAKASLKSKLPGKGLVQLGDRTVSVYGLIMIMAFALVLLLMSLASPASRLGGRH